MQEITNLEELRSIELSIMKNIHTFCNQYNIKYYLAYGTLIGAVRHKGFIPWDDDIDIHMLRNDYDKFIEIFPEWGKNKGLYIAGPNEKEHYYPRNMIKVCDANTILIEKAYKKRKPMGAFVDIWPLDVFPNKMYTSKFWYKKIMFYQKICLYADISYDYAKDYMRKRDVIIIKIMNFFNLKKFIQKIEKLSKRYNSFCEEFSLVSFQGDGQIYHREDFEKTIIHPFEDTYFYIPKGYDRILKNEYGNYMKLPPIEKQKPHHVQNVWYR